MVIMVARAVVVEADFAEDAMVEDLAAEGVDA